MLSNRIRAAAATVAALGLALGLGGCSVGPVDLDDFLMSTSVADAQAAARAELAPVVTSDALRQADTLTVGILTTESAPLSLAASDGSQSGIDVDVAHALADALGLGTVSFVSVSDVDTALAESCDVVMGVTAENAGSATVVGSYVQSATGVFTKQDLDVPADASALSGARVAVQGGSVSESVLMGYELDVTEVNVDNLNAGFDALDAGEADFVVCDAYAGAYLATAYPGTSFVGTLDSPSAVGIAVSGSNAELQAALATALDTISTNGVGDVARGRWVGSLPVLTDETRVANLVERTPSADAEASADGAETPADTTPAE